MKGFLFNAKRKIVFLKADRRTDETARKMLDIIGELNNAHPDTIERAKADPATLKDVEKRLEAVEMLTDDTRRRFYVKGHVYMDIPAADPNYLIVY